MNAVRHLLMAVAMILAVLNAGVAVAAQTVGKVTFVGTDREEVDDGYHARLRVRIVGNCDGDQSNVERWIVIRSGRMDGIYAHNGVNMRNAYSTLMAALLADRVVQIDGLPNCSTADAIRANLWQTLVGLLR